MTKGRLYLVLSAVLYGILPCLSAMAYRGGLNGVTLTFLRSCISLPMLYIIICADKRQLRVSAQQWRKIIVLGLFGGTMPILLLYISYQFIPTGIAASLHFIYPLIVVVATAFISHKKLTRVTLTAVLLVTAGIFMFADLNAGLDKAGIILALLSGAFYGFYVIYINRSGLDKMDFIVLTFYVTAIMSISMLIFGLASGRLYFGISAESWSISTVISIIVTLGAMPLFQLGVRYRGAAEAGIFSALEPVTSLVLGALVLGEFIGAAQLMGGGLILLGVLLIERRTPHQI